MSCKEHRRNFLVDAKLASCDNSNGRLGDVYFAYFAWNVNPSIPPPLLLSPANQALIAFGKMCKVYSFVRYHC